MPLKDTPNAAQQPVSEGVTALSDVVILPALQSEFGSEGLTTTMDAYREKTAERSITIIGVDPYGRSADS
jgi:hypothetical protein